MIAMLGLSANAQGIEFMPEGSLLKDAVAKAKKENKLVFLDCYTSWCGPCRKMAATVFTQPEVGNFMNKSYVSIKIDMEKGEGPALAKKYEVGAFPTFLIFNGDGNEVGRFMGGSEAPEFMQRVKDNSIDNGSADMDKRFDNGDRDEQFLLDYIATLGNAYKRDRCNLVAEAILDGKAETFASNPALADIFMHYISNPFSDAFVYTAKHPEALKAAVGDMPVTMKMRQVWEVYPRTLISGEGSEVTFDEARFNDYVKLMNECGYEGADRQRLTTLIIYAQKKGDWTAYMASAKEYWDNDKLDVDDLTLCRWATPIAKECDDAQARDTMKMMLQQRLSDLESGRRAPQTRQGNMTLAGDMTRPMHMMLDTLNGVAPQAN